jgi:hypothetical protein
LAFAGPDNAGVIIKGSGGLCHVWLRVGTDIADFSVGDWQNLDARTELDVAGSPLGPIRWEITPPSYWWRPRQQLADAWRPTGSPDLGEAWYGPFHDDAHEVRKMVAAIHDELKHDIADAVEVVFGKAAALISGKRSAYRPEDADLDVIVNTTSHLK